MSNLKTSVFLDETGVMLGLNRTHARSYVGTRACDFKPFYQAAKLTVIGAISLSKVLAVMTLNDSMDPAAFSVFIERCLCPQLWKGAVVVMDNLPAPESCAYCTNNGSCGCACYLFIPLLS